MIPIEGTKERVVFMALLEKPEGVTYLDFPGMTEGELESIVQNLRTGMYVSEDDATLIPDA